MKILVMAYHDVGYVCLGELISKGENVIGVVTHKDNPEENVWFKSVANLAISNNIPVFTPKKVNNPEFIEFIRSLGPDIIFSFYFRKLICQKILDIPEYGAINLHGSLLPKYRGRAPVNWVLVNGEKETGVTLHYMVKEADAGDIIAQKTVSIEFEDTAFTLYNKITDAAGKLLRETFPLIKEKQAPRIPQNHAEATYFGGRKQEDGIINWSLSNIKIYNLIRAVTHPYPGAFTFYKGNKLNVWAGLPLETSSVNKRPGEICFLDSSQGLVVATGKGDLMIKLVQFKNESKMTLSEIIENGRIKICDTSG